MQDGRAGQELAVLDLTTLLEAFGAFDEEVRSTLILYQKTITTRLNMLRQKLDKGDRKQAIEAAHAAKGISNTVGALRLAYFCDEVERVLRQDDETLARKELLAVMAAYSEVSAEIHNVLSRR